MGNRRVEYRVSEKRPKGRNNLEEQDLDRKIILKWICKKWDEETWTELLWVRIGRGGGCLWMW
jgi:hypothetical protein